MMRLGELPAMRACATKSRSRILNTSPRMTRAKRAQRTRAMANTTIIKLPLRITTKRMARRMMGKDRVVSVRRMRNVSTRPPA